METKRTRYGLTLSFVNGEWVTADGVTAIGRVRALEQCDGPHPMRYRSDNGRLLTGYCEGQEEHDHEVGWDVRPCPPGLSDDLYETLDAAWEKLAGVI